MAHTLLFRRFVQTLQQARRENLRAEGKPMPIAKPAAQWSRRRFVKSATLAGGAALTTVALSRWESLGQGLAGTMPNPRIAIVGGGIAGLNAAYQLKKIGLTATIYEAKPQVGGRIQSLNGAVGQGLVTELGGTFINSDHADILALVEELNLTLFNRLADAERFPFPETGCFFNGNACSEAELAEKLRPLAQQIADDAALLDEDYDRYAPAIDRLSVTDYLNAHADKIPEPFVRSLMENTIRTEYGVESSESSALQLLFNLPTIDGQAVEIISSDETFVVDGGTHQIIDRLTQALSGQIYTRKQLTRIQPHRQGYRLLFANGGAVDADYVILALPFTVLRDIDIQVNLPADLRRFINEATLGINEKVTAGFRQKAWQQASGFVNEAWTDLGFAAVWDETQRQSNRHDGALTFYMGGDQARTTQRLNASALGRQFVASLDRAIPGVHQTANHQFIRTRWASDPFLKGSYSTFKPGQLTEFGQFLYIESDDPEERQDVNVETLFFAGEHLSDEFYGFMNGAAQTGRLAVEAIVRQLQPAIAY